MCGATSGNRPPRDRHPLTDHSPGGPIHGHPPLLTIYIPTYNRAATLDASLATLVPLVIAQGGRVELAISDNASTDATPTVIASYRDAFVAAGLAHLYKPWRNPENLGMAGNFLLGLNHPHAGKFVWVLGDDDMVRPDALPRILEVLAADADDRLDFVFVNCSTRNDAERHGASQRLGRPPRAEDFPDLLPAKSADLESRPLADWQELLDPAIDSVFLGSIMCGVVRCTAAQGQLPATAVSGRAFLTLPDTYPHSMVWAQVMAQGASQGRRAHYLGYPCTITFWGEREWNAHLPRIVVLRLAELLDFIELLGASPQRMHRLREFQVTQSRGFLPRLLAPGEAERAHFPRAAFARSFSRFPAYLAEIDQLLGFTPAPLPVPAASAIPSPAPAGGKVRVLLCTGEFLEPSPLSGPSPLLALARALQDANHQVDILAPALPGRAQAGTLVREEREGVVCHRFRSALHQGEGLDLAAHLRQGNAEAALQELLVRGAYQLVHFRFAHGLPLTLPALAHQYSVVVCYSLDDLWPLTAGHPEIARRMPDAWAERQHKARLLLTGECDHLALPTSAQGAALVAEGYPLERLIGAPLTLPPANRRPPSGRPGEDREVIFVLVALGAEAARTPLMAFRQLLGNPQLRLCLPGGAAQAARGAPDLYREIVCDPRIQWGSAPAPGQLEEILSSGDVLLLGEQDPQTAALGRLANGAGMAVVLPSTELNGLCTTAPGKTPWIGYQPEDSSALAQALQALADRPNALAAATPAPLTGAPLSGEVAYWHEAWATLLTAHAGNNAPAPARPRVEAPPLAVSKPVISAENPLAFFLNTSEFINHYRRVWDLLGRERILVICGGDHEPPEEIQKRVSKAGYPAITIDQVLAEGRRFHYMVSHHALQSRFGQINRQLARFNIRFMYALGHADWQFAQWNDEYDLILCYGPWQVEQLRPFERAIKLEMGYPRFDGFFTGDYDRARILAEQGCDPDRPTVVWLPTWGEGCTASLFREAVASLTDTCNVVVKLHPLMGRSHPEEVAALARLPFTRLIDTFMDNVALFAIADFLVADYGGSLFGALYTDRNLLLLNLPEEQAVKVVGENSPELLLRQVLPNVSSPDPATIRKLLADPEIWAAQREVRRTLRQHFFAPYYGNSSQMAAQILGNLHHIFQFHEAPW